MVFGARINFVGSQHYLVHVEQVTKCNCTPADTQHYLQLSRTLGLSSTGCPIISVSCKKKSIVLGHTVLQPSCYQILNHALAFKDIS